MHDLCELSLKRTSIMAHGSCRSLFRGWTPYAAPPMPHGPRSPRCMIVGRGRITHFSSSTCTTTPSHTLPTFQARSSRLTVSFGLIAASLIGLWAASLCAPCTGGLEDLARPNKYTYKYKVAWEARFWLRKRPCRPLLQA